MKKPMEVVRDLERTRCAIVLGEHGLEPRVEFCRGGLLTPPDAGCLGSRYAALELALAPKRELLLDRIDHLVDTAAAGPVDLVRRDSQHRMIERTGCSGLRE